MPAIRISSIDFLSDSVRDKLQELAYQMEFICTQRSDDAVFAFSVWIRQPFTVSKIICLPFAKEIRFLETLK